MKGRLMSRPLFYDTYAIIEILKANPLYLPFKAGMAGFTSELNLMEAAYYLMKNGKENEIGAIVDTYSPYVVPVDMDVLLVAAKMKLKFLKERLSFVDCIGYVLAKKHNAKFLTGDEKFRHKENVEFVK